MFAWGANSHGQLGLGYASEMITSPIQVPSIPFEGRIELISGGGGHVLVSTNTGHVFSCGWNHKGQLGLGDLVDRHTFEEISLDLGHQERILQLSCGWDSSAVLTTSRLLVFGGNHFQQLGLKDSTGKVWTPRELKLPRDELALQIELSLRQIVVRCQSGILISGKSKAVEEVKARLGPFLEDHPAESPLLILEQDKLVRNIAAGQHHLIYSVGKEVFGIGQNKNSQSERQRFTEEILQLRSGWTHNACLLRSGEAYLWGRNCYGQLGTGRVSESEANPVKLNVPEKLTDIHLGSEHGLAVDTKGQIYTWGWNEHGNCGNGSEENVMVPEKIKLSGRKVVRAGCGEGFCLIWTEAKGDME